MTRVLANGGAMSGAPILVRVRISSGVPGCWTDDESPVQRPSGAKYRLQYASGNSMITISTQLRYAER